MGVTMKKLLFFILLTGFLVGNVFAEGRLKPKCEIAVYDDPKKQHIPECHLMKRWAVSVCLAYGAKDEETMLDAMRTAVSHGEAISMSVEESAEIMPLVKRYLARDYRSFYLEGVKPFPDLNTGKCLDLFYSLELDMLVVSVSKEREKTKRIKP